MIFKQEGEKEPQLCVTYPFSFAIEMNKDESETQCERIDQVLSEPITEEIGFGKLSVTQKQRLLEIPFKLN